MPSTSAAQTTQDTKPQDTKHHMILKELLFAGLVLFVTGCVLLFIIFGIVPRFHQPSVQPVFNRQYTIPTQGLQKLSEVSQSQLVLMVTIPKQMDVGRSFPVSAFLYPRTNEAVYKAFYLSNMNDVSAYDIYYYLIQVQPGGDAPGATLGNLFGAGYDLTASASLAVIGDSFAVTTISPSQEQSFEQYSLTWDWIVQPKAGTKNNAKPQSTLLTSWSAAQCQVMGSFVL